jgi:hypothetical protein
MSEGRVCAIALFSAVPVAVMSIHFCCGSYPASRLRIDLHAMQERSLVCQKMFTDEGMSHFPTRKETAAIHHSFTQMVLRYE